jgi:hypothetical protein
LALFFLKRKKNLSVLGVKVVPNLPEGLSVFE